MTPTTISPSEKRHFVLSDGAISCHGPHADWFETSLDQLGRVQFTPTAPVPARTMLQAMGYFEHTRGFPDMLAVMGRLLFQAGSTTTQSYHPFTFDPERELAGLGFLVETTPDGENHPSENTWQSQQALAQPLLGRAGIPWRGLSDRDIHDLVQLEPWLQPVEGCALYALAQDSRDTGACVIEIGSLRGQSTSMLAMALRACESNSTIVSIDPHRETPSNFAQVRLTLQHIGEESRLVQIAQPSEAAWKLLRPRSASLIFIDGDHGYDSVVLDFHHYRDLVAPGGYLAFHDYGYGPHNGKPDVVPDVRRAVDEHVFGTDEFEPVLLAHTLMVFRKTRD